MNRLAYSSIKLFPAVPDKVRDSLGIAVSSQFTILFKCSG